jgi:hypothetical protein
LADILQKMVDEHKMIDPTDKTEWYLAPDVNLKHKVIDTTGLTSEESASRLIEEIERW